jgi:TRAP transporter TAXI family solute receptor
MLYILLILIIIAILYYKTSIITKKYLSEDFTGYSLIKDKGIIIEHKPIKEYSMAIGEIDTPYHKVAQAINNISSNEIEHIFTNGSIANIDLVNSGKADFGICQEDLLYDKVLGLNKYTEKLNNIRFITSLHDELFFLIVPQDSPINSFQILKNGFNSKGENFIIGTSGQGSGSLEILKLLCNINSIELQRININEPIPNKENNTLYYIDKDINTNFNLLINKKIDGLFYVSGPRTSYIVNTSQIFPIKFIPLQNEQFEVFNQLSGNKYSKREIKLEENTLNNIANKTINTQGVRAVLICNKKIDENIVYTLLKEIYKNLDYIKQYMTYQNNSFNDINVLGTINTSDSWFKERKLEFIDTFTDSYSKKFKPLEMFYINKNIKYHKGAYKLYKELGYINTVGKDNQVEECKFNYEKASCNLVPYLNKKNYYWRYSKIPGLETEFKR